MKRIILSNVDYSPKNSSKFLPFMCMLVHLGLILSSFVFFLKGSARAVTSDPDGTGRFTVTKTILSVEIHLNWAGSLSRGSIRLSFKRHSQTNNCGWLHSI